MSSQPLSIVLPRVSSPRTGDRLLLRDEIESRLENKIVSGHHEVIYICGDGVSTALRHLADEITTEGLRIVDGEWSHQTSDRIQLLLTSNSCIVQHTKMRLQNWRQDEIIEYLLANHPDKCKSVMQRLTVQSFAFANGSPIVWSFILDSMAENEAIIDHEAIVVECVKQHVNDRKLNRFTERLIDSDEFTIEVESSSDKATKFLNCEDVAYHFAAERLVELLLQNRRELPRKQLHPRLITKVAQAAKDNDALYSIIERSIQSGQNSANAAMILLQANPAWTPLHRKSMFMLMDCNIPNVKWSRIEIFGGLFRRTNMNAACLSDGLFRTMDFDHFSLNDSSLTNCEFKVLTMMDSALVKARIEKTTFIVCQTGGSSFDESKIDQSLFHNVSFRKNSFCNAQLSKVEFLECMFENCDFTNTELTRCAFANTTLNMANLRDATLIECDFSHSKLDQVDLEYMHLTGSKFISTKFDGGDLTGSIANGVSFYSASLKDTGLADIRWENCNLRDADLRGASFYLGSTRCGLVGSPYPSHGTRTGFYTDDTTKLDYQPPEEIRKACLVGCDLRGANLDNVDFYLVDLRDARFDQKYHQQIIGSGGIL
jgi:uncharacterized protein YjbI with pentapeptide repeats